MLSTNKLSKIEASYQENNYPKIYEYIKNATNCEEFFNATTLSVLKKVVKKQGKLEDKILHTDLVLNSLQHFADEITNEEKWKTMADMIGKLCSTVFIISANFIKDETLLNKNIGVFSAIIDRSKCVSNCMFHHMLGFLLTAAVAVSSSNSAKLSILAFISALMQNATREVRSEVIPAVIPLLNQLSDTVSLCGNYEAQIAIIEILARSWHFVKDYDNVDLFSTIPKTMKQFKQYKFSNLDPEGRMFLNALNNGLNNQLVFSIPCFVITIDNMRYIKPKDEQYHEFWVDFNVGSKTISFYHQSSPDMSWDLVTIPESNIISAKAENGQIKTKAGKIIDTVKMIITLKSEDDIEDENKIFKIYAKLCKQFEQLETTGMKEILQDRYESNVKYEQLDTLGEEQLSLPSKKPEVNEPTHDWKLTQEDRIAPLSISKWLDDVEFTKPFKTLFKIKNNDCGSSIAYMNKMQTKEKNDTYDINKYKEILSNRKVIKDVNGDQLPPDNLSVIENDLNHTPESVGKSNNSSPLWLNNTTIQSPSQKTYSRPVKKRGRRMKMPIELPPDSDTECVPSTKESRSKPRKTQHKFVQRNLLLDIKGFVNQLSPRPDPIRHIEEKDDEKNELTPLPFESLQPRKLGAELNKSPTPPKNKRKIINPPRNVPKKPALKVQKPRKQRGKKTVVENTEDPEIINAEQHTEFATKHLPLETMPQVSQCLNDVEFARDLKPSKTSTPLPLEKKCRGDIYDFDSSMASMKDIQTKDIFKKNKITKSKLSEKENKDVNVEVIMPDNISVIEDKLNYTPDRVDTLNNSTPLWLYSTAIDNAPPKTYARPVKKRGRRMKKPNELPPDSDSEYVPSTKVSRPKPRNTQNSLEQNLIRDIKGFVNQLSPHPDPIRHIEEKDDEKNELTPLLFESLQPRKLGAELDRSPTPPKRTRRRINTPRNVPKKPAPKVQKPRKQRGKKTVVENTEDPEIINAEPLAEIGNENLPPETIPQQVSQECSAPKTHVGMLPIKQNILAESRNTVENVLQLTQQEIEQFVSDFSSKAQVSLEALQEQNRKLCLLANNMIKAQSLLATSNEMLKEVYMQIQIEINQFEEIKRMLMKNLAIVERSQL